MSFVHFVSFVVIGGNPCTLLTTGKESLQFVSLILYVTGKPIGKRSLGKPRRIWEGNIRMDLKETDLSTRN